MAFFELKKYQGFYFNGELYKKLSDDRAMNTSGRIVYVNPNELITRLVY